MARIAGQESRAEFIAKLRANAFGDVHAIFEK